MKKHRTIGLVLLVISSMQLAAQPAFKINQYNIAYGGDFMPVATLYTNYAFTPRIGFSSYFYVNAYKKNSWGEGLAGPNWTPSNGISLSLLAGFQTNEEALFRFSPVFFVLKENFSAFGSFEYGGKRHRWDTMIFYIRDPFKVGGELIRFYQMYAAGPRAEFSFFKNQPVTVFYSALWDWKAQKCASMFGIYTSFGFR